MSSIVPVLALVKSDWEAIADRPVVGKDVLELLSSSMYVNPLSIYREYVQNAVDAIEEAGGLGLFAPDRKPRIEISIDPENHQVLIRDNGTGLQRNAFVKSLVALGASRKRGTKARGFRGVGRLAGLGYCKELVFRSRAEGEREISELRWDCRRLKGVLRDPNFGLNLDELIKEVVRVRRMMDRPSSERFFEVELCGVSRHANDCLVSIGQIHSYLSQVAPVPFSPEFRFGKSIEDSLRPHVSLGNVLIYLNGSKDPIYRPHRNDFEVRKGVVDWFADTEFMEVKDTDGRLAAVGWVLHHAYRGAIDRGALIKGLRLRSGNMQVGESNVLDELFTESRFNSWVVGEIHVLDERILPNGRRDHFEQSVHFSDLINKLRPTAFELARRCRVSSLRRNATREFQSSRTQVSHNLSVVRQGVVGPVELKRLERDSLKELKRMERACSHSALASDEKARLRRVLVRMQRSVKGAFQAKGQHRLFRRLDPNQKRIYERFFSLIYECLSNQAAAKRLIDRILARM